MAGDKNWPAISVEVKRSKRRGGASRWDAVTANALTVMPCGHHIRSSNVRGNPGEEDKLRERARREARLAGDRHRFACPRCGR